MKNKILKAVSAFPFEALPVKWTNEKIKEYLIEKIPPCCAAGRNFYAAAEWYSIGVIHLSFT